MLQRLSLRFALACLVAMTLVWEAAAAPRVWVALAEEGGAYLESAITLRTELGEAFDLSIGHWPALFERRDAPPDLIVTIGVGALDGVLERTQKTGSGWERVPLLVTLLPQAVLDARRVGGALAGRSHSAVVLDQPIERQLAFVRRALPRHPRIGLLLSSQTRVHLAQFEREAKARDLTLVVPPTITVAEEVYPALKTTLDEADVVLAFPDPLIYHGASLPNILLAAYRARIPVVAFSPSYVKAGALLGLYSTPAQIARRTAEMLRDWLAGRKWMAPQRAREFDVAVNARVAASLGLRIDDADSIAADLRAQEERR